MTMGALLTVFVVRIHQQVFTIKFFIEASKIENHFSDHTGVMKNKTPLRKINT